MPQREDRLNPSIPRAGFEEFTRDPLHYLLRARSAIGDLFVLREDGPLFSRTPHCSGVVAVFGTERQRAVLGDIDTYGMPPSAAKQLALDETLTNLNRSLHSMRGEQHAAQKRILTGLLDGLEVGDFPRDVHWTHGTTIGLLREMRRLAAGLAAQVLFGDGDHGRLVRLLQDYFHLRRELSSRSAGAVNGGHAGALLEAGRAVDDALRASVRTTRGGLVARMACAPLTLEEVAGHANIFFVSATEPVAVALTWTLLLLSQLPSLRVRLRAGDPALLDAVLHESLRLLPPNAFMVRITTRAATLLGTPLPEGCEIVLCPFVSHRDPVRFSDPHMFRPSRWNDLRPSAFDYFPFGAGGHACIGRGLALQLMRSALAFLLAGYDFLLAGDQEIDWRLHIQFMPREDPAVIVESPGASRGGTLGGPVGRLLDLSPERAVQ